MNEKTSTSVSSEKEKVKESQSRSVTPRLTPLRESGWGVTVRIQGAWRLLILDVFTPFSYLCIVFFTSRQHSWDFVKDSMMGFFLGRFMRIIILK